MHITKTERMLLVSDKTDFKANGLETNYTLSGLCALVHYVINSPLYVKILNSTDSSRSALLILYCTAACGARALFPKDDASTA